MSDKLSVNELKKMFWFSRGDVSKVVNITPEMAERILIANNDKNRDLSMVRVKRLVESMDKGEFVLSNDSICFDENGTLTNGQHRLKALSLAKAKFCTFNVIFGISNFMGMDTGRVRTLQDNVLLFDECDSRLKELNTDVWVRVLKDALQYCTGKVKYPMLSQSDYMKIINKFADDLIFCHNNGLFKLDKGVSANSVLSAFFLAYLNGVDMQILLRVKRILNSGIAESDYDKPIIALRETLLSVKGGGREPSSIRHMSTQVCISKVVKKSKVKSVKPLKIIYTYDMGL